MGTKLNELIAKLKQEYHIIILDTPPLGLVTDTLELPQYADDTIYMVRLDYTKKGMLQLVNAKYRVGELKNISFGLNFYRHKNNYIYGYGYGYGVYGNVYHEKDSFSFLRKIKNFYRHF